MIKINYQGRLGNNMIQYFAGRLLAENNNLYLLHNSYNDSWQEYFHIIHPTTTNKGSQIEYIDDNNFLDAIKQKLDIKCYILNGFFQYKTFLHTYSTYIKKSMTIQYANTNPKEVFVHYRIGDIENSKSMLPIEYYEDALSKIKHSGGYISSDSIDHPLVARLSKDHKLRPISMHPLDTINFGKNFKQLVLSEGTFSWWIGFLSRADTVICNQREYRWFGSDIFDFDHWIKLSWGYNSNKQPINKG